MIDVSFPVGHIFVIIWSFMMKLLLRQSYNQACLWNTHSEFDFYLQNQGFQEALYTTK